MASQQTELATAFIAGKRIRQMNLKGTVQSTVTHITTASATTATEPFYICPLQYKSMIRCIRVFSTVEIPQNTKLQLYGLARDKKTPETRIEVDLCDISGSASIAANTWAHIYDVSLMQYPVYVKLCSAEDGKTPIASFANYKDDDSGMLCLYGTVLPVGEYTFVVETVPMIPSASPYLKDCALARIPA